MEARRRENPGDSIKDHIVRRFYNQRCDLVTRLRFEPVNLERGFLLFEWFVSKGGGGEVGGEKKKNWRIGPIKSRGGGGFRTRARWKKRVGRWTSFDIRFKNPV